MDQFKNGYVCAFRGRRDSYQVPLALAENGILDTFITDAYALPLLRKTASSLPLKMRQKFLFRHESGIPDDKIKCLWGTTAFEHLRHYAGCAKSVTYAKLDSSFSRAAARRAAQRRSNLLLYSPYALEAFLARYPHDPHKVMFQFHPHSEFERKILEADHAKYPFVRDSFREQAGLRLNEQLKRRERDAWKHADLVFCASSFTAKSLMEAGAKESLFRIVPYGIDLPETAELQPITENFEVLFVGSGGQRKGLHHLLLAWKSAALPKGSRLTLVCRVIDNGIERLAHEIPSVQLLRGLNEGDLKRRFSSSTLFAMPSLVEGFGQVYLEALAQGCPVLGTTNTCLPDIKDETDAVSLVEAGNIEELIHQLEVMSGILPGNLQIRISARKIAARFSWRIFRGAVVQNLNNGGALN